MKRPRGWLQWNACRANDCRAGVGMNAAPSHKPQHSIFDFFRSLCKVNPPNSRNESIVLQTGSTTALNTMRHLRKWKMEGLSTISTFAGLQDQKSAAAASLDLDKIFSVARSEPFTSPLFFYYYFDAMCEGCRPTRGCTLTLSVSPHWQENDFLRATSNDPSPFRPALLRRVLQW